MPNSNKYFLRNMATEMNVDYFQWDVPQTSDCDLMPSVMTTIPATEHFQHFFRNKERGKHVSKSSQ